MVIHTIYAAFVVNRSIVESSNFVIEVYMCFLVIYCFSEVPPFCWTGLVNIVNYMHVG